MTALARTILLSAAAALLLVMASPAPAQANDDYWDNYARNIRGLKLADVQTAADDVLHPGKLVWVVVGDREKIEAGVRSLALGPIQVLDADGKVVPQAAD